MDNVEFLYGQVHIVNNEITRVLSGVVDITASKILNCDIEIDGIFPDIQTGTIYNGINTVPGAIVTVFQNGYIVDKYETSSDGQYYLFLEPGEYELNIKYPNQFVRKISSFKVKNGIKEFCGIGKRSEYMKLIEKDHKVIFNTKVLISQSNSFKALVEVDELGYYQVALEPGQYYDVQIRKRNCATRFYKNILYNGERLLF